MSEFEFNQAAQTKLKGTKAAPEKKQAEIKTEEVKELVDSEPSGPTYSEEELAAIFDEIIFSGEYAEEITIKGKLKVKFRTRTTEEIEAISGILDKLQASLMTTLNEKRSVLNLQYALVAINGKEAPQKIEEKAKYLGKLPGPIVGAMINALAKFDDKVFQACKDAEENF